MRITHRGFEVTEWQPDRLILNPYINPEVVFFGIHTRDEISSQAIIYNNKNARELLFLFFGIKWMYTITTKHTMKDILYYEACDLYLATDIVPFENDQIKNTVINSFNLFSKEFDNRKVKLGVIDNLPYPSENEFYQAYLSLLSTIKK